MKFTSIDYFFEAIAGRTVRVRTDEGTVRAEELAIEKLIDLSIRDGKRIYSQWYLRLLCKIDSRECQ